MNLDVLGDNWLVFVPSGTTLPVCLFLGLIGPCIATDE